MKTTLGKVLAVLLLFAVVALIIPGAVSARGATIKDIESGDTIFSYEENLDISALRNAPTGTCGGGAGCTATSEVACEATVITAAACSGAAPCPTYTTGATCVATPAEGCTWTPAQYCTWTPGAVQEITYLVKCTETPESGSCTRINEIPVPDDEDFTVYSSLVSDDYGIYYAVTGATVSSTKYVRIQKATDTLDVVLSSSHIDSVNGKSVTRDTGIVFEISSSYVASAFDSLDGNKAQVRIIVKTPGGAELTTFEGVDLSEIDITSPQIYYPAGGLDLGDAESGTYRAHTEWVYPTEFESQAPDSNEVLFTVSTKPLTITTNKESVVKGTSFTVTITGEANKMYYVYVKSGAAYYPALIAGQSGIEQIVNVPGETDEAGKTGTAAKVTTDAGGSRTVGFGTYNATSDETFDIKVVDPTDDSKYDTVSVEVMKGEISVTMGGTGSFYMGEDISLSGENTETDLVYLFITGPNLYNDGVRIDDPAVDCENGDDTTFKVVDVDTDNTWKYKWDTSDFTTVLDAGSYTIYAVSEPLCRGDVSEATYETASIVLKKPFITARLSSTTVASGDEFKITGTASGNPNSVYVWIFGKNYRNMFNSVDVNNDGTYEYKLSTGETEDLYAGQYYVVVQHPMSNGAGIYAIDSGDDECSGTGCWGMTSDANVWGSGAVKLSGLQASDAATALTDAISSPNIDDLYAKASFLIDNPFISITSIPTTQTGTNITVSGTTNLGTGDDLLIDVVSASFGPTNKSQSGEFSAGGGMTDVVEGTTSTYNEFSMYFDTAGWKPDEYLVTVESVLTGATATSSFILTELPPTPVVTPTPVTPVPTPTPVIIYVTPEPTAIPTPTEPIPTPTEEAPGFGAIVALIGLVGVAFLVIRR